MCEIGLAITLLSQTFRSSGQWPEARVVVQCEYVLKGRGFSHAAIYLKINGGFSRRGDRFFRVHHYRSAGLIDKDGGWFGIVRTCFYMAED